MLQCPQARNMTVNTVAKPSKYFDLYGGTIIVSRGRFINILGFNLSRHTHHSKVTKQLPSLISRAWVTCGKKPVFLCHR